MADSDYVGIVADACLPKDENRFHVFPRDDNLANCFVVIVNDKNGESVRIWCAPKLALSTFFVSFLLYLPHV